MPGSMQSSITRLSHECAIGASVRARLWSHDGPRSPAYRPVGHPGVELSWVEEGCVDVRVGRRTFSIGPGQAVLVPAFVEHVTTFAAPSRAAALWLGDDLVAEAWSLVGRAGARVEPGFVADAGAIVELGRSLAREVRSARPGHLAATESIAEAMTVSALRDRAEAMRASSEGPRDPRVRQAIQRIHDAYAEPLTVEELARTAGTTRFHFTRLFRDDVGEPPYRYLVRVRVARAAELLRSGRRSVTEVAFSVGFTDLGRFARAFRRELGENPGAIARRARSRAALS